MFYQKSICKQVYLHYIKSDIPKDSTESREKKVSRKMRKDKEGQSYIKRGIQEKTIDQRCPHMKQKSNRYC